MSFTEQEIDYLQSQPLARLATVGPDEQPDVVPVAFELDGPYLWIAGTGVAVKQTRKARNVEAGRNKVAVVVDDLVSFDPFIARSIRIYGVAEPLVERVGLVGPGFYMRITPTISWSWNMAGEPLPDDAPWYEARRTVHDVPAS